VKAEKGNRKRGVGQNERKGEVQRSKAEISFSWPEGGPRPLRSQGSSKSRGGKWGRRRGGKMAPWGEKEKDTTRHTQEIISYLHLHETERFERKVRQSFNTQG